MVTIAVPSSGDGGLNDVMDQRFGRCMSFTIVTLDNKEIKEVKTVPNGGPGMMSSAGILAAQTVGEHKVDVVIVGFLGPNAANALNALNLKMYQATIQGITVQQAINLYLEGKLQELSGANVGGHFGMGGGGRGMGAGGGMGGGGGMGSGGGMGGGGGMRRNGE